MWEPKCQSVRTLFIENDKYRVSKSNRDISVGLVTACKLEEGTIAVWNPGKGKHTFLCVGLTSQYKLDLVLVGFYAPYIDNFLLTFRDNLLDPSPKGKQFQQQKYLTFEYGSGRLSQNVGKKLPIHGA